MIQKYNSKFRFRNKSKIHFIYNEDNEANYFYGKLNDFKNLNIKDNSSLQKENQDNIFL